jgi:hypothetical protein
MAPSRAKYEAIPRRSSDSLSPPLSHDNGSDEFKDKPVVRKRRIPALIRKCRRCTARVCRPLYVGLFLAVLLLWQISFNVPYADSKAPKYEVDTKETVFIAANIIDGDLIRGAWGRSLLELVERIGKERVFVSIYGGPTDALKQLEGMLECESSIVSEEEDPLNLGSIPRTTLPTGEKRVKRIAFLAEVRNKALAPLEKDKRKWDKVLFINDVYFEPEGALRLLWGTNTNQEGRAEYKAVCAADFVTSWKYYDTFATRDAEGFSIGVPIFPWFSAEGDAATRKDILSGRDAVRVKSCWGGMVAFDGRYFQNSTPGEWDSISATKHHDADNKGKANTGLGVPQLPLRFRSEPEPFWDSSECCLIHADIMSLPSFPGKASEKSVGRGADKYDTGIYMNPFVRVAYDAGSFKNIWIAKRFERMFALLQRIINGFAHMPRWNYRRTEEEGQLVPDKLWISVNSDKTESELIAAATNLDFGSVDDAKKSVSKRATLGKVQSKEYWAEQGYYAPYNRTAKRGGYCGVRQLLVVKEGVLKEGEGNWDNLLSVVPPVDV